MHNHLFGPDVEFRRIALALILPLCMSACAGPVGPTPSSSTTQAEIGLSAVSTSATGARASRVVTGFPLLNGTFTLSAVAADGTTGSVTGTYTGQATAAIPGNTTATLDMHPSSSDGFGSTVTELLASGSGAFIGAGDFSLTVTVSTTAIKQDVKTTLRGTSTTSCSTNQRILVTQHATGSTSKFAAVTIDMQHEVGLTGCTP